MLQPCFLLLGLLWSSTMSIQAGASERDRCLPTPSQDVTDTYKDLLNLEEQCNNDNIADLSGVSLFVRSCRGQMELVKSKYIDIKGRSNPVEYFYKDLHLPANVSGYFLLNISCLLDFHELNCSWNTADIPNGVQYSISAVLCNESEVPISWNCTAYSLGNLTGCQGKTISNPQDNFLMIMRVNVSLPGFWYIHTESFEKNLIEKLDPPNITGGSFRWLSEDCSLEIQWKKPASSSKHFTYEIKINDDVLAQISDSAEEKYLVPNIDQTIKYTVCMRVTVGEGARWSDWSKPTVMGPAKVPEYSTIMILAIVFGLPMVLLVFLLVFWKLHRIIFPAIPKPHIRVKSLLERDDPIQIVQENYAEEVCVEEVTEMNE